MLKYNVPGLKSTILWGNVRTTIYNQQKLPKGVGLDRRGRVMFCTHQHCSRGLQRIFISLKPRQNFNNNFFVTN